MKTRKLIITLLVSIALPAAADFRLIQEAHEVALSDLRIPQTTMGTIAFKGCTSCDYHTKRVSPDTTYRIGSQAVTLDRFRTAVRDIEDRENTPVTVVHHLKRNQVTEVVVIP